RHTGNPHLPVPAPSAATGPPGAPAARRGLSTALRAAGPGAAGCTPTGLGAALRATGRCRRDRQLCRIGRPRARLSRPGDPDHESAPLGSRYSGNALVLTADGAWTGPDSPASASATDADGGLGRTAQALARVAQQPGTSAVQGMPPRAGCGRGVVSQDH